MKISRTVCAVAAGTMATLALAACGNNYRPVVSSINPVGPAGQPTKYAVAVSTNPETKVGLVTLIDVSGDTIVNTTLIGVNPFYFNLAASGFEGYTLNGDGTLNSFSISSSLLSSQVLQSTLFANANPVSIFSNNSYLYIAETGRNAVAQLSGTPPGIQQELPTGPGYIPIYTVGAGNSPRAYALAQSVSATGNGIAVPIETASNTVDTAIPVGIAPVYGVVSPDSRRAFILNKGSNTVTVINAQANALDQFPDQVPNSFNITGFSITNNVVTFVGANTLTAGTNFSIAGLQTGTYLNGQTLTVLAAGLGPNQFSATFTHTNVASSADIGTATRLNNTIPVGIAPVWADLAPTLAEVLVANAGSASSVCPDGVTLGCGSVTIFSIPLCSATTVTTNPNCDVNNPVDAVGFGQVLANIPVGVNPIMIAVLQDGSQAFVANAGTPGTLANPKTCVLPAAGRTPNCSVSVINLTTNTVVATIPFIASTNETDSYGHGHPNWIGATTGTPKGKAYVTAGDSTDITIIRSDLDTVQTHLSLQGNGLAVRMNQP